jgi:hypothetical protein
MCPCEESWQRRHDAFVSLTQECGQNVFADPIAPQVVAAVAARVSACVEVDPVVLGPAGDTVASVPYAFTVKSETSLQPIEIDTTCGVEVDENFGCHLLLPIQSVCSKVQCE